MDNEYKYNNQNKDVMFMSMGITLIYPNFKRNMSQPPTGVMSLAAYLRENDVPVKILDTNLIKTEEELKDEIKKNENDIMGISCMTPFLENSLNIVGYVKEIMPKTPVILGGPHPTVLPRETLKIRGVDYIVIGEGEITLLELIKTIEKGRSLAKVKGIGYKEGGKIKITEPRPPIENLDELPMPARDLLPTFDYYCERFGIDYFTEPPATTMFTSRGCPFNCNFCQPTVHNLFGRKTRFRSPEKVVEEIIFLKKKYGINKIYFQDDTFTLDKQRVHNICRLIKENDLHLRWAINSRVNTVNRELIFAMKKAGCENISFGVESCSQKILNNMNKGTIVEQEIDAFRWCNEAKMFTVCNLMLGYPGETMETMNETRIGIRTLRPDRIDLHITFPEPGTVLYEQVVKSCIFKKDYMDYAKYSRHAHKCPLKLDVTDKQIVDMEKQIYKEFRNLKRSYILDPKKWYSVRHELRIMMTMKKKPKKMLGHMLRAISYRDALKPVYERLLK